MLSLVVGLALGCGEDEPQGPLADPTTVTQPPASAKPSPRAPEPDDRPRPRRRLFPGPSRARRARVTGVTDGDTISLSGIGKTRLIGVDTPEVFGGAECFGRRASAFTKRALRPGRRVRYRLGVERRDRYGRALAYVWLRDGRLFNGLLVERGYAQPLTIPPNVDLADRFRAAARRARRARRGLWGRRGCTVGGRRRGGSRRRRRGPRRDRDCSDFRSRRQAQRYFERQGGGRGRNVDRLDSDRDGRACESLP